MQDAEAHQVPPHLVREELARIEMSAAFRQSDQLRSLLRHLVTRTLEGDGERLKEIAHDTHLVAVPTHPLLAGLHDDPRWPAWLRRRGFADAGAAKA